MTRIGIDEDWQKPPVQSIVDGGYTFVAGYVSEDMSGKNITAARIAELRKAGIAVCLVYEYRPRNAVNGWAAGTHDGRLARDLANSLGWPTDLPIYAAVDFAPTSAEMDSVLAYLRGFADANGGMHVTGVYGSYATVKAALDAHEVIDAWQTYAWSNGQWDPRACLRQVANGITVGGRTVDRDEATTVHFGQWEGDMAFLDDNDAAALAWRVDGLTAGVDKVRGGPYAGEGIWPVQFGHELEARVVTLQSTVDSLRADVAAKVAPSAADVASEIIRQLKGGTP